MRLVGLLAVVAIIAFAYSRRAGNVDPMAKVDAEMGATPTPQAVVASPGAQPSAPGQPSSGLRRPIDRTRQVLEQVKGRNGAGEF